MTTDTLDAQNDPQEDIYGLEFTGEYAKIPAHMQEALRRYVLGHRKPGDFLYAVICNDLQKAVGHADEQQLPLLRTYVRWFYNIAQGNCWGSPERMKGWLARSNS